MNTFRLIVLSLAFLGIVFSVFMLYRNNWTAKQEFKAVETISKYAHYLIDTDQYDRRINYFDEILVEYGDLIMDVFNWNDYAAIKPEYRESLIAFYLGKE